MGRITNGRLLSAIHADQKVMMNELEHIKRAVDRIEGKNVDQDEALQSLDRFRAKVKTYGAVLAVIIPPIVYILMRQLLGG